MRNHSMLAKGRTGMGLILSAVCAFLFSINACKKVDIGPDVQNDPVFIQDFKVDTTVYQLFGGQDNQVYMFTHLNPDASIESALANENCPDANCPKSLHFLFEHINVLDTVAELHFKGTPINSG